MQILLNAYVSSSHPFAELYLDWTSDILQVTVVKAALPLNFLRAEIRHLQLLCKLHAFQAGQAVMLSDGGASRVPCHQLQRDHPMFPLQPKPAKAQRHITFPYTPFLVMTIPRQVHTAAASLLQGYQACLTSGQDLLHMHLYAATAHHSSCCMTTVDDLSQ